MTMPSRQRRLLAISISVAALVAAGCTSNRSSVGASVGAAYLVLDPFAPNWQIEEVRLPGEQVQLVLTMKRYYSGGAGEARQVFHRRASEMMRAGGFSGYEVLDYSEETESSVLGAQRTAQGLVRFTHQR